MLDACGNSCVKKYPCLISETGAFVVLLLASQTKKRRKRGPVALSVMPAAWRQGFYRWSWRRGNILPPVCARERRRDVSRTAPCSGRAAPCGSPWPRPKPVSVPPCAEYTDTPRRHIAGSRPAVRGEVSGRRWYSSLPCPLLA